MERNPGGLPKHDPAVMLAMLVLLWTPVAMFRLSGAAMIRDDLHHVGRIQSAGPFPQRPGRPSSRTCAQTGAAMIAVLSS